MKMEEDSLTMKRVKNIIERETFHPRFGFFSTFIGIQNYRTIFNALALLG